jgi:carbonic anhydrase/acetyltransferase-like protein (isoleucine patch superfamily)
MIQPFRGMVPRVHPTAWVHDAGVVIGDVEIGPDVSIWPTAVMRGDMGPLFIGEKSNLQDGAVCHNTDGQSVTRIGKRVTIGHRAILHGCTIEDDCLIGMGAIVMDNAVIGTGSIVGAGAIVLARRVIPPGSMVLGAPGKVARALSDDERRWIQHSWRIYLDRASGWPRG